jgi:hypothetical protein
MATQNKLHNQSTADLADEFGNVKAQIEALEAKEKELKEELAHRIDDTPAVGQRWTVTKSDVKGRETFDKEKFIADFGEDSYKLYVKTGKPSVSLRVKPTMVLGEAAE